jgi:hypothetical protein
MAAVRPVWLTRCARWLVIACSTVLGVALLAAPVLAEPTVTAPDWVYIGSAQVGATLDISPDADVSRGAWSPSDLTFVFQWFLDGVPMTGATSAQLRLTPDMAGHEVSGTLTGSAPGYQSASVSSAVQRVELGVFYPHPRPNTDGLRVVGQTLTSELGTWDPAVTGFAYQWLRNGTAIPGAQQASYVVQSADIGALIEMQVTATAPGYAPATESSDTASSPSYRVQPCTFSTGHATVRGMSRQGYASFGGALTAVPSPTWYPTPTSYTYQWYRVTTKIPGATSATYRPQLADLYLPLHAAITGHHVGCPDASVTTDPVGIEDGVFTKAPKPTISGTARVGRTLTVNTGTWSPKAGFTYRWYRNGAAISGATKSTYKLTTADRGRTLTVRVTGSRAGYAPTKRTSAPTARIR